MEPSPGGLGDWLPKSGSPEAPDSCGSRGRLGWWAFVGELEVDGPGAEHDECEGGVGGVDPVGPSDDRSHPGVRALGAAVAHAVFDGVQDDVSSLAHGAGGLDEGSEAGPLGSGALALQQHAGRLADEVAGEDGPELFLHLISRLREIPRTPTGSAQMAA